MPVNNADIDFLAASDYPAFMETVTLKMGRHQIQALKDRAAALNCSQAAVIRDLIDRHLDGQTRPSLHDQAKDLCGSVSGPKTMSTRKLKRYGRS